MAYYLPFDGSNDVAESQAQVFNTVDSYSKLYIEIELEVPTGDNFAPFSSLINIPDLLFIQYRSFVSDASKLRLFYNAEGTRLPTIFPNGLPIGVKFKLGILLENDGAGHNATTFIDGVLEATSAESGNLQYFPRDFRIAPVGGSTVNVYSAKVEFDDIVVNSWTAATAPATGAVWPADAGSIDLSLIDFAVDPWVFYPDAGGGAIQELTLIAATQANNSSSLSISSSSLLNAVTATQNNNTSLMLINAIQQLNSISATQLNSSQLLSLEQQQSLQTIIAAQLNIAGIINLESVQAVSFITATQSNTAATLNLEQFDGQVVTLIAAEQVNEAQTILISQISSLDFLSANQINESQALNIGQISKLNTINAQQINTAAIMNILSGGDDTDLSGLELVQISEVYDLLKIKNEYSLIKK